MTIQEAIEQALPHAGKSKYTQHSYQTALRAFVEYLRESGLDAETDSPDKLTAEMFIALPFWLQKTYKLRTARVYGSGIRFFFEWLAIRNLVKPTPNEMIFIQRSFNELNSGREKRLPKTPRPSAVDRMLQAVREIKWKSPRKERAVALIEFLACSGCRIQEALSLKIADLDFEEYTGRVTGKGSRERTIYLNESAVAALREYWKIRGFAALDDPVFASSHKDGEKRKPITPSTARDIFEMVSNLAGIPKGKFTPHSFRHNFATVLLNETGDLALVQKSLGHSSPETTRIYAEVSDTKLREAHRKAFDK